MALARHHNVRAVAFVSVGVVFGSIGVALLRRGGDGGNCFSRSNGYWWP